MNALEAFKKLTLFVSGIGSEPLSSEERLRLEKIVARHGGLACRYAREVVKGRWPIGEKSIFKSSINTYIYTRDVVKARLPEAEDSICKSAWSAREYARNLVHGRWDRAENKILTLGKVSEIINYARDVMKCRWPEGEKVILEKGSPGEILWYVRQVVNGRWPEGEEIIKKEGWVAFRYAFDVIKDRWLPGEESILSCRRGAARGMEIREAYLIELLRCRDEEFEKRIRKSKKNFAKKTYVLAQYVENCLGGRLPDDLHNMMILVGDENSSRYVKFLEKAS